ncbi:YCF48-related protein [Paraburkholderia sediminicola]|uniref:WD40/YVTN/BNR-like repeat-containing protein n=1 Tax=Paraburkholderia sediminicola TaxID=458836 RepID=UPI0038BCA474
MRIRNMKTAFAVLAALALGGAGAARAESLADPASRPAAMVVEPTTAVLVDVSRAGPRLVAVGERGIVLVSDDNGARWRQMAVPVSVTLTAVRFLTPQEGWAVGHSGIVLHTVDGGLSWSKQLDGLEAAASMLRAANAAAAAPADVPAGASAPRPADAARRLAQQFVDDGPDKPFLDICFDARGTVYVTGAYGLIFASHDRGRTWQPWLAHVDNPDGFNLYAMKRTDDALYLTGEQGYFARSLDGGEHFERIRMPYDGSFFALAADARGDVTVAGLRGTIMSSDDGGASWHAVPHASTSSIDAAAKLSDGVWLFASERGDLLASHDAGRSVEPVRGNYPKRPVAALVEAADGSIVTVGYRGIEHFKLADQP